MASLQRLADGGDGATGDGKRYDRHGRLVSETYEEFVTWAADAGLIPRTDLVA